MKEIGIRELKARLTTIVRAVHDEQVEYTITVHGQPVAILRPIGQEAGDQNYEAAVEAELAEIDAIIAAIDAKPSEGTARETLEQMREESAWR